MTDLPPMRVAAAPTRRGTTPPGGESQWRSSTRARRLPRDWRDRRQRVLARDQYLCQDCGAEATEVDHAGDPDDHDLDSLRSLCKSCHMRRTQRQAAAARKAAGRYVSKYRRPEKHPGIID